MPRAVLRASCIIVMSCCIPVMNIQEAIAVFDGAEAESLVVVESGGEHRPIGILTEAHAMRRYAEESEQRRREAVGDI
jgi:chloride channel protein, CIC family